MQNIEIEKPLSQILSLGQKKILNEESDPLTFLLDYNPLGTETQSVPFDIKQEMKNIDIVYKKIQKYNNEEREDFVKEFEEETNLEKVTDLADEILMVTNMVMFSKFLLMSLLQCHYSEDPNSNGITKDVENLIDNDDRE